MGKSIPFSKADFSVTQPGGTLKKACLIDTNFLIALSYEPHRFHEVSTQLYYKLADAKVPIYVSLSTRSEFLEFQRRVIATEQLMGMLTEQSEWRITHETKKRLYAQKVWIDQQASKDQLPVLSDNRIKELKQIFTPKKASGHHGWLDFCDFYFNDLLARWEDAAEAWGLNYLGRRETEDSNLFSGEVKWKKLYQLSGKTCLGSFDSMLLNVFLSSKIQWLISTDFDLAYGMMAESDSREVLVPDSIHRNNLKALRF